ncbi:CLUMA_CG009861, isoform A [Clunio marinus]|uniref:CLUMA_CG009861, isoform A n=1 Tax=Clunio marinus TaxID=568069 RepID=A0A1J1IDY5_9DIPT|nr:CLUMA_CG009861, isoform A [Clunio marinus]
MDLKILLTIGVMLALLIVRAQAIKCYFCNTLDNNECWQNPPPAKFLVDCSKLAGGENFTICRRMTRLYSDQGVKATPNKDNTSLERHCAVARNDSSPCMKTWLTLPAMRLEITGNACTCTTNDCNGAEITLDSKA